MIEEKKMPKPRVQNVILENRQKLSISGVVDVESLMTNVSSQIPSLAYW